MSKRLGAAVVGVAAACAIAAPGASAAPARIAFAGDGSIFTMNADGSERVKLTNGNRIYEGPVIDGNTRWSPDGRTIAFDRSVYERPATATGERDEIWAMDADGDNPRRLLLSPIYSDDLVGFTRRGEVLVARARRHGDVLVAVDPDTGERRQLGRPGPYSDIDISPDGRRLAGYNYRTRRLTVANVDGSHPRAVARQGYDPNWSPDAKRLAFVSEKDRNGQDCYESCYVFGEIYTVDADGSNARRLTVNKGDDRAPRWSPDGKRIAFQSDRNYPSYSFNTEVYSIEPNGQCLTWLTNGAIQSGAPDWRPGRGDSAPGGCGESGRKPIVDLDLSRLSRRHYTLYWFGPMIGGRTILSEVRLAYRGTLFWWGDCGHFDPRRCGDGKGADNHRTCIAARSEFPDKARPANLMLRRGALVVHPAPDRFARTTVYTGETTVDLDQLGDVSRLRRYPDAGPPAGDLPPALLPDWLWEKLREVEESYARTHDEEATANELGVARGDVHRRRLLAQKLRELGVDGEIECPDPGTSG